MEIVDTRPVASGILDVEKIRGGDHINTRLAPSGGHDGKEISEGDRRCSPSAEQGQR